MIRGLKGFKKAARCTSGSVAVEFALIGLILIMTLLGIIELGRGLYFRSEMAFASDLAARRVYIDAEVADSELESVARSAVSFGTELQFTFGTIDINGQRFRTISIDYPFTLFVPGLTNGALTLRVNRRVPV